MCGVVGCTQGGGETTNCCPPPRLDCREDLPSAQQSVQSTYSNDPWRLHLARVAAAR